MADELQALLKQTHRDGVGKADAERQPLLAEARAEAVQVVAAARRDAEDQVAMAKSEAERRPPTGEQAIHQAARDIVLSLGEKLTVVVNQLPSTGVTLAEIRTLVGQDGLLLLTAFLTLVFMVPVSIPGVSTVFGGGILLIGISRLLGRNLWLPKRLAHRVLPAERVRTALIRGSAWLHRLERVSRPHRLNRLASPGLADTLTNAALILGALLLMAPFGLIPFSNTLPALALLLLAIGRLQRDGLCLLLGHLANLVTIAYFAFLLAGGGAAIRELFHRLHP